MRKGIQNVEYRMLNGECRRGKDEVDKVDRGDEVDRGNTENVECECLPAEALA
jgi:hypothetical protein